MNSPLVSIIVPMYNHCDYIEECLNSLLNLEYDNYEVIICDDGSKDNSYKVAATWLENNPKVQGKLYRQKNQGVCHTLNRLVKEAAGEYIAICASDDALTSNSLCQRVAYLENNESKAACIGDANLIDQSSNTLSESAMKYLYNSCYQNLSNNIVKELVLRWAVVGPTLLIRKSAYEQFGYYDESLKVEDRDYYLRLLANDALVFLPISVAKYRVHTGNSSRRDLSSKLMVLKDVAISNVKYSDKYKGVNRAFLKSHIIDLFIMNKLFSKNDTLSYIFLSLFRLFRRNIVKVAL
ncbi:glycosyltransferase family A protein [Vibrio vulnificus]